MTVLKGYTTDLFYTPNKKYRWRVCFLDKDENVDKLMSLHMSKRQLFEFVGRHKAYHSVIAETTYPEDWDKSVYFEFVNK